MSTPLSTLSPTRLNQRDTSPEKKSASPLKMMDPAENSPKNLKLFSSSPFQTEAGSIASFALSTPTNLDMDLDQENLSPLQDRINLESKFDIHIDSNENTLDLTFDSPKCSTPSPLKMSPKKHSSPLSKSPSRRNNKPPKIPSDETLSNMREEVFQSQLKRASMARYDDLPGQENYKPNSEDHDAASFISDDTCFSTFSAVPNVDMTLFANLRPRTNETSHSPIRPISSSSQTSGNASCFTPGTSKRKPGRQPSSSPSPTPRQSSFKARDGETTTLLLDFTQQFQDFQSASRASPTRRGLSPTKTEPNLLSHINNQRLPSPSKETPAGKRAVMNLLDFDLPPQPTPRSVPSITIRELESLKSTYLSEISSLKASLSGKEAEVESLKKAVNDAERRVGEALETLQEEQSAKEDAERLKDEWEKKSREVECHFRELQEEFSNSEREKEELVQKLDESNRLKDKAELEVATAAEAKSQSTDSEAINPEEQKTTEASTVETLIERRVTERLDEKMETLARELHAVYKKKHESKVATLKKTYEARSEKKCREMQHKIDELSKQNDELQASKGVTFSGEVPGNIASTMNSEEQQQQLEAQKAEIEEHKTKVAGLTEEMKNVQCSYDQLLLDLERERVEKGELVAAVDEMLALQAEVGAPNAVDDFRKSVSRPASGLRGPGFGAASASGLARPSAGGPAKSRMMMGIERMGKH